MLLSRWSAVFSPAVEIRRQARAQSVAHYGMRNRFPLRRRQASKARGASLSYRSGLAERSCERGAFLKAPMAEVENGKLSAASGARPCLTLAERLRNAALRRPSRGQRQATPCGVSRPCFASSSARRGNGAASLRSADDRRIVEQRNDDRNARIGHALLRFDWLVRLPGQSNCFGPRPTTHAFSAAARRSGLGSRLRASGD